MITLTEEQLNELVGAVISSTLEVLEAQPTEQQSDELVNVFTHANNLANGYDDDGNKVGVAKTLSSK